MDVIAHTLWANAGARKLNKHIKPISIAWASFWGVFPDLFSFLIPTFISFFALIQGKVRFDQFSHHGLPGVDLSEPLYDYSHSLVIFVLIFFTTWLIWRYPPYVLLGWGLHILLDIPTHPTDFYPTPFLWPLSDYVFPYGFSWREPWFIVINYGLLLCVFFFFYRRKKLKSS